ncbi:hypothetical protein Ae263Ps1_3574 [Pseudonocardia sp. Ae263_Ps1]|nr:hypothetical protein Ae263Ps1_3574 [Pseudonocardia sp. Ae263_Ps1]
MIRPATVVAAGRGGDGCYPGPVRGLVITRRAG